MRPSAVKLTVALGAVATMLLAACSGVPEDSSPRVIKTVPINGANNAVAATTPAPGTPPRVLVSDFLQANVADASAQTSPRGFLTAAARANWSDTTVTVVDDPVPGLWHPAQGTVLVTAKELGQVNAVGQYVPATTNLKQSFQYKLRVVKGQWRIDGLPPGLVLSESAFALNYIQRPVYYFAPGHRYLVPDPRWTSLSDPTQLANWLMAGLTGEPSDQIKNAIASDSTLPPQATARRINVRVGSVTKIEIPGASQLQAAQRDRLAEQVATTLSGVPGIETMQITDGGHKVRIPDVQGSTFDAGRYTSLLGPPTPPPDVYFLRDGFLYAQDGTRVRGRVNEHRSFYLQSVAVSQDTDLDTLDLAATAGPEASDRLLLVGTESTGLRQTKLRGPLTRPAFAPGRSEVWVGDGTKLYAIAVDNVTGTQKRVSVALPSGLAIARIIALRLSPDGSRLAIVLRTPGGQQQLYVGAVIRGPGQIRIDTLQPLTPAGVVITDVAWAESAKLLATGYEGLDHRIYDVGVDGSNFSSQGIGNLPDGPTTLTVVAGRPAWVTANNSVWKQFGTPAWISPGPSSTTQGYAPVYLE